MITNILNESGYYFETWNTLRFAAKAKSIKINPKANYISEGGDDLLKMEVNNLLRRIDELEKQKGTIGDTDNFYILKLVDRLEIAWDAVSNGIDEKSLLAKNALQKADDVFIDIILELKQELSKKGADYILKTKYIPILEEIEGFFEKNQTFTSIRDLTDKMDTFSSIIKDEIQMIKEPILRSDARRQAKLSKWRLSLEKIDEIISDDEEEEKQVLNSILVSMDEKAHSPPNRGSHKKGVPSIVDMSEGANKEQLVPLAEEDLQEILFINHKLENSMREIQEERNRKSIASERGSDFKWGEGETGRNQGASGGLGGRGSTEQMEAGLPKSREEIKLKEYEDLLMQFKPQKIRMIVKENELLNRKIKKQRYFLLEMKEKLKRLKNDSQKQEFRQNRSYDDISDLFLDKEEVENIVEESMMLRESMSPDNMHGYSGHADQGPRRYPVQSIFETNYGQNVGETHGGLAKENATRNLPTLEQVIIEEEGLEYRSQENRNWKKKNGVTGSSATFPAKSKQRPSIGSQTEEAQVVGEQGGYGSSKQQMVEDIFSPARRLQVLNESCWRDTGERMSSISMNLDQNGYPVPEETVFGHEAPGKLMQELDAKNQQLDLVTNKFKAMEREYQAMKETLMEKESRTRKLFRQTKEELEKSLKQSESLLEDRECNILRIKELERDLQLLRESSQTAAKQSNNFTLRDNGTGRAKEVAKREGPEDIEPRGGGERYGEDPRKTQNSVKSELLGEGMGGFRFREEGMGGAEREGAGREVRGERAGHKRSLSSNRKEAYEEKGAAGERGREQEVLKYLKQIDKLQKENDMLMEGNSEGSRLKLHKLKLENKKLKEAIRKIAGKVKQEIGVD